MLRQAWSRFKIFTQRVVAPSGFRHCSGRRWHVDRCADELVDAFIAVPVTSLFRSGMPRCHDRDRNYRIARESLFAANRDRDISYGSRIFVNAIPRNNQLWITWTFYDGVK